MSESATQSRLASLDVELPRICFGTMRLDRTGHADAAAALLNYAFDAGITGVHCSSEYDSFPLFREAWARGRFPGKRKPAVIAKIGVPHFGESAFSADAFRRKVDFYLRELGLERIDVIQWLLRFDLQQEEERLRILEEAREPLAELMEDLRASGKAAALVSFPYTDRVAERALDEPYCDGLALYVNPLEREMERHIRRAGEKGKAVVAIRPFAAGRLFAETTCSADAALAHVFAFPAVETAVVSASSRAHIDALRHHL